MVPLSLGGLVDLLLGLAGNLLSLVPGLSTELGGLVLSLLALDLSVLGSEASGLLELGRGVLCEERSMVSVMCWSSVIWVDTMVKSRVALHTGSLDGGKDDLL
jgi:hypothetical protein